MSEMVERVARAIVREFEVRWDACTPVQQEMARVRARAAVAAMREPTEVMVKAGEECFFEHMPESRDWTLEQTTQAWREMIDAALKDAP